MPNLLGITLLEMIARKASSGYDLAYQLKIMQNTHHSQIYPTLAKLEEAGLLHVEKQVQDGKPNKKIYTITEAGLKTLYEWSEKPAKIPVTRDEFTIKLQLDWLNPDRTSQLLNERKNYLNEQCELINATLTHFENELGLVSETDKKRNMSYQIYLRKKQLVRAEIDWCNDLLEKNEKPSS
ncbi:PadR family transcriptional regulator [Listeria costaricensis]|uniref:PadR family transcriptional regulator n=1 Tax=Listeria costaricensis TaxID=2026604 RepID=UPI000C07067F|nr:PadR family transcriptional regulator [Listeria costaricensis]